MVGVVEPDATGPDGRPERRHRRPLRCSSVDDLQTRRIPGRTVTLPAVIVVSDGEHEVRVTETLFNEHGEERAMATARLALARWAAECRDGKCGVHRNV